MRHTDAFTSWDPWGRPRGGPEVLPLPVGAQSIASGAEVTLQADGSPLYLVFHVVPTFWQWFGVTVSFNSVAYLPHNMGVYGPNPTSIGPPFGRMRAPKLGMADALNNSCKGTFSAGVYYLVFRSGTDGAPLAPITVSVK